MKISKLAKSLLVAALGVTAMASANATLIIGRANLTIGSVIVSFGNIDWNQGNPCNLANNCNPPPNATKTYGEFATLNAGNTGVFNTLFPVFSNGSVQDMSGNLADANYIPIGASSTQNYLSFVAQPNWTFSLTSLEAGNIAGAPYTLTQVGSNVSATISMNGVACDAGLTGAVNVCDAADDKTNWTGIFSAQYTNTTIAAIISTLLGPDNIGGTADDGVLDNNTWSATIEATKIPEPASLAIVGLALAGVAGVARRRSRQA